MLSFKLLGITEIIQPHRWGLWILTTWPSGWLLLRRDALDQGKLSGASRLNTLVHDALEGASHRRNMKRSPASKEKPSSNVETYTHKQFTVPVALTFMLTFTSWTALAWLACFYARPLAITLSGQSVPPCLRASVFVCVCVAALANGFSLIHSINSFLFLRVSFSPSTQFI